MSKKRKESNDEDRASIYVPKYSFTRYLNDIDRPRRREKRYNKIKKSDLKSSKHYIKYCIKNNEEAKKSKLINKDFTAINKLRCFHNMKSSRNIDIDQNIGISTITRLVIEMIEKNDTNIKLSEIAMVKKSKLINKVNTLIKLTMGEFKVSKMDMLSCSEKVQKRVIKDRENEVFVFKHDYYERILGPFNKIIEYLLEFGKESYGQGVT